MAHDEESEATRKALVTAARDLFGTHGYRATKISTVANAAGMTTGAIYHHFQSKKGLFQATVEALLKEMLSEAAKVGGPSRWHRLRASFTYMLDRHSDDAVFQIIFVDAPYVMGQGPWQELNL